MSTVTGMALAAFVVSILALVISVISLIAYWRQVKWAKVAARANEELARIEQARHASEQAELSRATIDVRVDPVGKNSHVLVVTNDGPNTARNVTVELAPRAPGDAPGLHNSPFPATIAPGAETSAHLDEGITTATLVTATVTWSDGAGHQTRRVDLTIG